MKSVYVLSAFPAGLGVIRALGSQGVPIRAGFSEPKESGRKSRYIGSLVRLPDSETCEQDYLEQLLADPGGEPGEMLVPTSDQALSLVSRNKPVLARRYTVACPDWCITEKFLDKKNTYQLADMAGVPAPGTYLPKSIADIDAWGAQIQFPCLAKPFQVHIYSRFFPRKMTLVNTLDELVQAIREAEDVGVELMVQEFIPGGDALGANYNAYYWEGKPLVEFTAHKLRNAPPVLGSPSALISEKIPEVVELGRRLLGSVSYSGYACTEFKRDPRDGTYKLMEVNARHNLSTRLAIRCGINFPWIQYLHLMEEVEPQAQDFETGIYWVDISRDVGYRLVNFGKENLTPGQFIQPYLGTHVFAVLDWKDPGPALIKAGDTLIAAFSYGFDRFTRTNGTAGHQPSLRKPRSKAV